MGASDVDEWAIEDYFHYACNIAESEFGISAPDIELELTNKRSRFNIVKQCIYYNPDDCADVFFHEFSHALFTQFSYLGKQHLRMCKEIISRFNEDNKDTWHEKLDLFKQADCTLFRPVQEGFAEWMGRKLSAKFYEDCGLNIKPVGGSKEFSEFYQGFVRDEQNKGLFSLLYSLGFPFSKCESHLLKFVEENIPQTDSALFVLIYGSRVNDLDVFVVGGEEDRSLILQNRIDAFIVSKEYLNQRVEMLDIEVAEPLLTGHLIKGRRTEYLNFRRKVLNKEPDDATINFACTQANVSFEEYCRFRREGMFVEALNCLSYAVSYTLSAYFQNNDLFLPCHALEEYSPLFKKIRKKSKNFINTSCNEWNKYESFAANQKI